MNPANFNEHGLYNSHVELRLFIKTDEMLAFEFVIDELLDIYGDDEVVTDLFRLEQFSNGKIEISVASEDDYYVYDEATDLFDVETIFKELKKQFIDESIYDATNDYIRFMEKEKKLNSDIC